MRIARRRDPTIRKFPTLAGATVSSSQNDDRRITPPNVVRSGHQKARQARAESLARVKAFGLKITSDKIDTGR
jgi:hypothetical protein